ncbi:MAG: hypothetical protein RR100_21685, partial [Comamonas sp.]
MWTSSQLLQRPCFKPLAKPLVLATALLLGGCAHQKSTELTSDAQWQQTLAQWSGAPAILLGEQHDQTSHHQWEAAT